MTMKRTIPLIAIAIFLFTLAPAAQADCWKCRHYPLQGIKRCVPAFGPNFNFTLCWDVGEDDCATGGSPCSPELAMTSFATDYRVASVERLEEPAADDALVATLETPATTR